MPRQVRIDAPGILHHIICRGIKRRCIFIDDDDRDDFVNRLSTILLEISTTGYAWALIPNHFHLLLCFASLVIKRFTNGRVHLAIRKLAALQHRL